MRSRGPTDIESYGTQASREGLAIWGDGGGVTVFTASHWTETNVVVALHPTRPSLGLDAWDHVVEAGMTLGNGRLHIYGPEDAVINEASVALPPGSYSLPVCGNPVLTRPTSSMKKEPTTMRCGCGPDRASNAAS